MKAQSESEGSVFMWAAADLLEVDVIKPPNTCNLVATLPRQSMCHISSAHSRSNTSLKAPHPAQGNATVR